MYTNIHSGRHHTEKVTTSNNIWINVVCFCERAILCIFKTSLLLCLLCNQNHAFFFIGIFYNHRKFVVFLDSNSVAEISEWYFECLTVYVKRSNCSLSFPFSFLFLHFPLLHFFFQGKAWQILYLCTVQYCSALSITSQPKTSITFNARHGGMSQGWF